MNRSERLLVGLGCLGLVMMLCLVSAGSLWMVGTGAVDGVSFSTALDRTRELDSPADSADEAPANREAAADEALAEEAQPPAREQSRDRAAERSAPSGDLRTLDRSHEEAAREALPLRGAVSEGGGQLTRLYEQVNPGVVSIAVQQTLGNAIRGGGGSGFVFDDRHLVTNNHVIDQADSIEVIFYDGSRRKGTVIGADAYSDLAVVEVDDIPASARTLPLEDDFGSLKVGQPAVAIGAPFGNTNSMTYGIISALGRTIPADLEGGYSIPQSIQTDAAINPGNSGGPLLNLSGEVIGINAQINTATPLPGGTAANSGVGFAIPSSIVARVVPELIAKGEMVWAYLGVQGLGDANFTIDVARANGLTEPIGAYILGVPANGPSSGLLAGIDEAASDAQQLPVGGDIVIGIDDQPVDSFDDLLTYISIATVPGQEVELRILRAGDEVVVPVTVGERPGQ